MLAQAGIYHWLTQQGLWPTSLGALLDWLIPVGGAFLVGPKVFGHWLAIARRRAEALERTASAHEAQADHLAAIHGALDRLTTPNEAADARGKGGTTSAPREHR